jgi:hypothetical protein
MNPTIDFSELPLRDIHLPQGPAWWPPAPGWWLLAAALLAGLALFGLYYYRSRHRRAALRALRRVQAALEQGAAPSALLQTVSTVMRRFAMTSARSPGAPIDVPGLVGERWLAYLDGRWQRDAFVQGAGRLLLAAPYARPERVESARALELVSLCTQWLKAQPAMPALFAAFAIGNRGPRPRVPQRVDGDAPPAARAGTAG